MSYYFYIDSMMLPVPPAKMSVKIKGKNKTVNLINEGEVNIIKTPGLTEISFDARLPNRAYPYADYNSSLFNSITSSVIERISGQRSSFGFKRAAYFMEQFEQMKTSQTPVRLVICRMSGPFTMLFDTNMLVTLESYSIEEDAVRDSTDVTCPLKFKQYKPYGTKECEVTTDEDGTQHLRVKETRPAIGKTIPKAIQISHQKSVWEAVKGISNGSLDWRSVMSTNGLSNPADVAVGTILNLNESVSNPMSDIYKTS